MEIAQRGLSLPRRAIFISGTGKRTHGRGQQCGDLQDGGCKGTKWQWQKIQSKMFFNF